MQKNKKGFTVMEVMISIVVVSIFAAIALPNFYWSMERARAAEAIQIAKSMWVAREAYKSEYGEYTNTEGDLDITYKRIPGWDDPYLSTGGYVVGLRKKTYPYSWIKISPSGKVGCYGSKVCPELGLPFYWQND
jgi:prepilin-type N-terminal cleavage/methylation domain-containing protein